MLQYMRSLSGKNEKTKNTPGSNTNKSSALLLLAIGRNSALLTLANRASAVQSAAWGVL